MSTITPALMSPTLKQRSIDHIARPLPFLAVNDQVNVAHPTLRGSEGLDFVGQKVYLLVNVPLSS